MKKPRSGWGGTILTGSKPVGRVVSAHIPIELAKQVDQFSVRLRRPKGWIINQALASWVANEGKRLQMAAEDLRDAVSGKPTDKTAVDVRTESLGKPK